MSKTRKKDKLRPSAVVAILRELEWEAANEERDDLRNLCSAFARHIPKSGRVVLVDPDQVRAFIEQPDDDLFEAALDSVPPFWLTVLDTGFVPVGGGYRMAGIVVYQQMDDDGQPVDPWAAIAFCRNDYGDWGNLQLYAELYGQTHEQRRDTLSKVNHGVEVEYVRQEEDRGNLNAAAPGVHAALAGVLSMLESVNVELVDGPQPVKAHRAHGIPHHEVVIRQPASRTKPSDPHVTVDWSHRWEVRGHFKHFGPDTALYQKSPHRRLVVCGRECVRLWCPPHVKGPAEKPFIPKTRIVA